MSYEWIEDYKTQRYKIGKYLLAGKSITALGALKKWGCFRLGARVWELKRSGLRIKRRMVVKGQKRFAEYSL